MGWTVGTSITEVKSTWYNTLDRTDRTRHRICYADTYQAMFDRLDKDIIPGKTKHVLLLLGVPIGERPKYWKVSTR
jgi:hypothetical protein